VKAISGKELCAVLERHGWQLRRITGSHHIYAKPEQKVRLSVPVHGSTPLKVGLLRHLLKAASRVLKTASTFCINVPKDIKARSASTSPKISRLLFA
jgi:predicted RNA binding protein YcfA (HicA-like mRNA interferase family)